MRSRVGAVGPAISLALLAACSVQTDPLGSVTDAASLDAYFTGLGESADRTAQAESSVQTGPLRWVDTYVTDPTACAVLQNATTMKSADGDQIASGSWAGDRDGKRVHVSVSVFGTADEASQAFAALQGAAEKCAAYRFSYDPDSEFIALTLPREEQRTALFEGDPWTDAGFTDVTVDDDGRSFTMTSSGGATETIRISGQAVQRSRS